MRCLRLNWVRLGRMIVAVVLTFAASTAQANPIVEAEKTEIRIQSGDAVLAATLYRPAGVQGNVPAVVIGHGSGPVTRKHTFWTSVASIGVVVSTPRRTRQT